MKIGIDAKWFFKGPPSGTVVIRNIVEQLIKLNTSDELFLFLNKSDKGNNFPFLQDNVKLIYIKDSNNLFANLFLVPLAARKLDLDVIMYQNFPSPFGAKKSINYIHDILFLDYPKFFTLKEKVYLKPIKYLSKYCNHIITISNSEKNRVVKHRLAKENNVSVVYHGVTNYESVNFSNEDLEAFKKRYNLPSEFILYLGRLNSRKNIYNLLKAMPDVANNTPLVIAGSVDHKMFDINKLISELGLKNRVIQVGFVPERDLNLFYSTAKIFCFPSYAEGFGLPPLEAMALGTPTVVSNTTSMPEVCGDAALYVNPDDYKDIATQINKLLIDKEQFDLRVTLGKEQANKFKKDVVGKEIYNVIKSVVND
ncbi:glycosyltransferase family 4 protein [Winogradskyella undariae]|uniref:glycosyltransferase family 4 protein n=1 Tax=Winogradskyella undariae TaxID=1285465 RepID=UPI00156B416E|nr:glycosyltransferase family 1 protein [Winogradskyella undariae]NRR91472.1 glycosyltransferase family 4 protein [Winogradskyella undariae]